MELTLKELKVLARIGMEPNLTTKEIAKKLDMNQTTVSSYTSKFRKNGLILKAVGKEKEVGIQWMLTGKGRRLVKEQLIDQLMDIAKAFNLPELKEAVEGVASPEKSPKFFAHKPKHARKK